jgi:hypothetical protein
MQHKKEIDHIEADKSNKMEKWEKFSRFVFHKIRQKHNKYLTFFYYYFLKIVFSNRNCLKIGKKNIL